MARLSDAEWGRVGRPVVELAKREVLADIARGTVPEAVRSFADLHDYVDANGYGGAFESDIGDDGMSDEAVAFWDRVHDDVDQWLKAGRPGADRC